MGKKLSEDLNQKDGMNGTTKNGGSTSSKTAYEDGETEWKITGKISKKLCCSYPNA